MGQKGEGKSPLGESLCPPQPLPLQDTIRTSSPLGRQGSPHKCPQMVLGDSQEAPGAAAEGQWEQWTELGWGAAQSWVLLPGLPLTSYSTLDK